MHKAIAIIKLSSLVLRARLTSKYDWIEDVHWTHEISSSTRLHRPTCVVCGSPIFFSISEVESSNRNGIIKDLQFSRQSFNQACNVQNLILAVPAAALRADLHGFAVTLARYIAKFRPFKFFCRCRQDL